MYICPICGKQSPNNYCEYCNGTEQGVTEFDVLARIEEYEARIVEIEEKNEKRLKSISYNTAVLAVITLLNAIFGVLGAAGMFNFIFR